MMISRRKSEVPWGIFAVVAVVWAVLLFTSSRSTFWDRDEARYATASLEMSQSGNWLYPTFNHELRAFQPVMVYWLMGASISLFGPSELSVRLVSTVAITMVCLLIGLIAREMMGTGTMAAAIAGTSPMLLLTGTAATTDALLLLFILIVEGVFVHAWLHGPRRWHVPVMGVAMGFAMLTKGPVGLVVPVLSISTALIMAKGRSKAGRFGWKLASVVGIAFFIFLAWGIPANAATGGEYWRIAIVERLPKRLFTAMENHGGQGLVSFLTHLPYYLVVLAVGFLPWTLYLPWVGRLPKQPKSGENSGSWSHSPDGLRVLLIGMIVPTLVLMTLIVSKLPHYIQPVFPWLAIFVALWLVRSGEFATTPSLRRWLRATFLVMGIPAVFLGLGLVGFPWFWAPAADFRIAGLVIGVSILALVPVIGFYFWRGEVQTAARIHVAAVWLLLLAVGVFVLPVLERIAKPAQTLARELNAQLPEDVLVATYGWREPGMHFYLGARKLHFIHDPQALEHWLNEPGPRALILNESEAGGMVLPPPGFQRMTTQQGWNVVNGKPLHLSAYLRK
ncbi:MAG: glycosyltransferase family 39 protein [Terrimicrobiaceae bacterium]